MWEYLIEYKLLEEEVIPIAAGYAVYYRNKEIAEWLLQAYGFRETWDKCEGGI
jgi:hypothetical protein